VSQCRQQTYIDAPVPVVWRLIADVDRHPEWWPRIVEVQCEGLEPACTYREVVRTPFGKDEFQLFVEDLKDCERFRIRCLNTGTYFDIALTEARGGTFVDGEAGMEPQRMGLRVFDAVAGKRYFDDWLRKSLLAMREVAEERANAVDTPG
jgi:hypothetical protein